MISPRTFSLFAFALLAFRCTFEVPYALARDVEVNADSARAFGRDLARALHACLQTVPPIPDPS